MRMPEIDEPVTRGRVVVDRGEEKNGGPANALHAFSQGALFGLIVAGQILYVFLPDLFREFFDQFVFLGPMF